MTSAAVWFTIGTETNSGDEGREDGKTGSVHERGGEALYPIFLESVGLRLFVLKRTLCHDHARMYETKGRWASVWMAFTAFLFSEYFVLEEKAKRYIGELEEPFTDVIRGRFQLLSEFGRLVHLLSLIHIWRCRRRRECRSRWSPYH